MKQWLIGIAILASGIPALAQRDFLTSDEVEKVRDAQDPNDRLKLYVLFARQRLDQLQRLLEKEKKGRPAIARELLEDYTNIIDALDTVSDDALKRGGDSTVGINAARDAETRFLTQLQKIRDRTPSDLDLYNVELTEALAATSDSLDLSGGDQGARAAKLKDEDKQLKQQAEQSLKAENKDETARPSILRNPKPVDEAAADASTAGSQPAPTNANLPADKPARKPPTLYRPGEKPDPDAN